MLFHLFKSILLFSESWGFISYLFSFTSLIFFSVPYNLPIDSFIDILIPVIIFFHSNFIQTHILWKNSTSSFVFPLSFYSLENPNHTYIKIFVLLTSVCGPSICLFLVCICLVAHVCVVVLVVYYIDLCMADYLQLNAMHFY